MDVYSYGVLLCEMCIRHLPDPKQRNEQVASVTNDVFRELIQSCIKREPEARPTMEEIISDLDSLWLSHGVRHWLKDRTLKRGTNEMFIKIDEEWSICSRMSETSK